MLFRPLVLQSVINFLADLIDLLINAEHKYIYNIDCMGYLLLLILGIFSRLIKSFYMILVLFR